MNAFRKRKIATPVSSDIPSFEVVSFVPTVDATERGVVTHLERKIESPEELSERVKLPSSKDFSLQRILASGQFPQEVSCRGLIGSDELPDVAGAFSELKSLEKTPETSPTPESSITELSKSV